MKKFEIREEAISYLKGELDEKALGRLGSLALMVHSTGDSVPGNMIYDRAELVERGLRSFYERDGLREVDLITFANAYKQVHGEKSTIPSAQPSS